MCRMCEGFSLDDVLALDAANIAEYGFTLIGVGPPDGGDPESPSWVYTVGLLDAAGHPEMIMSGAKVETNASVLGRLATAVLAGERFEVGDAFDIGQGDGRVGAVHPIQYELNTFNMWHNLRNEGMLHTSELEAVQIILPSTFFCSCHADVQPLLDDPAVRIDAPGPRSRPNRAERRRRRPRGHAA